MLVDFWPFTKKDNYTYEIISKFFIDGVSEVVYGIKRKDIAGMIILPVSEIYYDLEMLEQFKPSDIRDISYAAAMSSVMIEKDLMQQTRRQDS